MKPNPTAAKAALDAATTAYNEANRRAQEAYTAAEFANADALAAEDAHRAHCAAAYLLAKPERLARLRELVARGDTPGEATPMDKAMAQRHGLVRYEAAHNGHNGPQGARDARSAPRPLALATLALIDAPEPTP